MSAVAPDDAAELAAVLTEASASARTVRVVGGGTRSRRGRPVDADLTLSLANVAGIVDHEPADMTVTVRAGTRVTDLLSDLERAGQGWPQADVQPRSTVGGVLATGASGLARLRYGPVRDSLLEVVAATGDGRLIRAGARTVKSVAGYDLPRLLVGSDGTLGVIVQATLRLWPLPAGRAWFVARGSEADLAPAARDMSADPRRPWSVVLVPGELWVQLPGAAGVARPPRGMHGAGTSDPDAPAGAGRVLVGVCPAVLPDVVAALAESERPYRAQVGVGTIEVGVERPADVASVRAMAAGVGGHAVVTDGPAELRGDPFGPPPAGVEIMKRIRAEFDPAGVLNPGRLAWGEPA